MNLINHYAKLALDPAWIDQARHRVRELEKLPCGTFQGLGQAVKERIAFLKEQQKAGAYDRPTQGN